MGYKLDRRLRKRHGSDMKFYHRRPVLHRVGVTLQGRRWLGVGVVSAEAVAASCIERSLVIVTSRTKDFGNLVLLVGSLSGSSTATAAPTVGVCDMAP